MLPNAAPATDLKEPPTLTLGKKQSYYKTLPPVVYGRLPAVLRGAAASHEHADPTGNGTAKPSALWSRRARGARKAGPGSIPLPEGIEVCCRPSSATWGPAAGQHLPASPAAGTLCVCVSNPSDAGHRMQAVGPEAAHRATLDPNITQARGARDWFGRARALAREPRSHHRRVTGLLRK